MIVFLNGKFVDEREAVVSVFDRSFMYGDGLFETVCVRNRKPFRLEQHLARLQRGAEFLRIKMQFNEDVLSRFAAELITLNEIRDGVLRIHLSRGVGLRGYSIKGTNQPTLVMTLAPSELSSFDRLVQWRLMTSSVRLTSGLRVALFKTANKLLQIIARVEAEQAGADEALLLDTAGHVVEAASANLFWISGSEVCTPPVESGILPGVTRAIVLELCERLGLQCVERMLTPDQLRAQQGVFLTLSTLGVVEAIELDGQPLSKSDLTLQLWRSYCNLLERETA